MFQIMGFRENLKSELTYSGMLVKELAERSGVSKHSLDNYLSVRGQLPSVEAGAKIARALNVSVEYLVTGENEKPSPAYNPTVRSIIQTALELSEKDRETALEIVKVLRKRSCGA